MRTAALFCLSLLLVSASCTEEVPSAPPDETGGAGGSVGGAGGAGGSGLVGTTTVEGTVVDTEQTALGEAQVSLCVDSDCTTVSADAMGAFRFEDVAPASYRIDVRGPVSDAATLAGVTLPLDVAAETPVTIEDAFVLPTTGAGTKLEGGRVTIDVTDELHVTIDGDELSLPQGVEGAYLAGVLVDEADWPANAVPQSTVAMWALNPYGATSAVEATVEIDNVFGLAADTLVEIHTVDPQTGLVVKAAEGSVSSDGQTISLSNGVRTFTWLILALLT